MANKRVCDVISPMAISTALMWLIKTSNEPSVVCTQINVAWTLGQPSRFYWGDYPSTKLFWMVNVWLPATHPKQDFCFSLSLFFYRIRFIHLYTVTSLIQFYMRPSSHFVNSSTRVFWRFSPLFISSIFLRIFPNTLIVFSRNIQVEVSNLFSSWWKYQYFW